LQASIRIMNTAASVPIVYRHESVAFALCFKQALLG
jgi:hypothetical protein